MTAEARLKTLLELEQKLIADWRKAVDEAKKAAESTDPDAAVPALMMRPDFGPVVAKAREFAAEFAGTDDAVPFLIHALQNVDEPAQRLDVLDTLLADHIDSPKLAQLGGMFGYLGNMVTPEYGEQALAKLLNSADPAVRGWARLATTGHVIEKADRDGEEYRSAKETLLKIAEEAGDVWGVRGWPTVVILDLEMRIHYRGHDGKEATKVAQALVAKMTAQ